MIHNDEINDIVKDIFYLFQASNICRVIDISHLDTCIYSDICYQFITLHSC